MKDGKVWKVWRVAGFTSGVDLAAAFARACFDKDVGRGEGDCGGGAGT